MKHIILIDVMFILAVNGLKLECSSPNLHRRSVDINGKGILDIVYEEKYFTKITITCVGENFLETNTSVNIEVYNKTYSTIYQFARDKMSSIHINLPTNLFVRESRRNFICLSTMAV